MKRNTSIKLKAASLLTVFGLNTVVGFACAVGMDMSFNTSHHESETNNASIHIHADGKKHHHQQEPVKASTHIHTDGKKHEHNNEPATKHQEEKETPKKDKDDCCNEDLLKFQQLDKNLNQNAKTAIDVPALVAIIGVFIGVDILKASPEPRLNTHRYLFPPPPNILIAIQKFQI